VYKWLEPDDGAEFNWLAAAIVALVIVSLISLALETEATRPDTALEAWVGPIVDRVNAVVVYVFAAEYLLRFWSAGESLLYRGAFGRLRFMVTPLAVADLLAFLPELLIMLYMPNAQGSWLAALRALRLFRLFKLARYVSAFGIVGNALKRAGAPLFAAFCVAAAQVYVAALLLYFIEGDTKPAAFGSVVRAMWWAVVTLTTVGYGDVYPETPLGRFAAGLVAVAGIGIVAMPTGILASAFNDEFRAREEARLQRALQGKERANSE
jgi:voltage-gated potassium channel